MVSFLIFRKEPKLNAIFKVLKEVGVKPAFRETKTDEDLVFTTGSVLSHRIHFDSSHNSISYVCFDLETALFVAHFYDRFNQAVNQQDLLAWYYEKTKILTEKIREQNQVESFRNQLENFWQQQS